MSDPYSQVRKARQKKAAQNKRDIPEEIDAWRLKWREAGVVKFAESILDCPPDVPVNEELGVVPPFIVLSEDQKKFMNDISINRVTRFILSAGRGSGKTFCLAVYVTWRITCFDNFSLTVMGGSMDQSMKIKEYVDFWRNNTKEIFFCLPRSVLGGNTAARVESKWNSYVRLPGCSETSARGSHVTQLLIDEVCVGESKSKEGAKAVRSARYQLTASADSLLGYTSTAQYILGTFYHSWVHADELGFTKYRWSIARHISESWFKIGTREPNWNFIDEVLYKDRDPNHWINNVWWITAEDIRDFRRNSTDDEFLVEVLGGMSRGSGLVFSRDDLLYTICNGRIWNDNKECEVCDPYTSNCPMMIKSNLKLEMISDRKMGFDFGEVAPNAMTITGQRGRIVFVLYSDERTGASGEEILRWIKEMATQYNIYEIFADPEERGMRQAIEAMDYSTPNVWANAAGGGAKRQYVSNVKRHVEKHILIIPIKFTYLVQSIEELSFEEGGDIRKVNDHSFDSLMFSMVDYDVDDEMGQGFYGSIKNRTTKEIWDSK